jgi:YD repeat-containing protein
VNGYVFLGISAADILIASEGGEALYHFDPTGRHLRTLDALTGAELYRFGYDDKGQFLTITDRDGDATTIERDSIGAPVAIVAPDGRRTALALEANGYLAAVTNPAGETHRMAYTADGLLTQYTDRNGHVYRYNYDSRGRLIHDTNPVGRGWTLARTYTPRLATP